MSFDRFYPIVLDIQSWASSDPVLEWRQNEKVGMGRYITILKKLASKMNF